MGWDLYITENSGNGGTLRFNGKDIASVYSLENQTYLGMVGGNVEQDTEPRQTTEQSQDWWGNNLMARDNPSIQMNSKFERTINEVALTSNGRQLIENAIKEDLKFLKDLAIVDISVVITDDNRIEIKLQVKQNDRTANIIIINFKKATDGDFYFFDFNDDFLV